MDGGMKNYRAKRMSVSGHAMPSFTPMGTQARLGPAIEAVPIFDEDDGELSDDDDDEKDLSRQPSKQLSLQQQPSALSTTSNNSSQPDRPQTAQSIGSSPVVSPAPVNNSSMPVYSSNTSQHLRLDICPDIPASPQLTQQTPKSIMSTYSNQSFGASTPEQIPLLGLPPTGIPSLSQTNSVPDTISTRPQSGDNDEDPSLRWIELEGIYDRDFRIYFNTLTKETTHIRPASYTSPHHHGAKDTSPGIGGSELSLQLIGDNNEEKLRSGVEQLQKFIDGTLMHLAQAISPAPPAPPSQIDEVSKKSKKSGKSKKQSVVSVNASVVSDISQTGTEVDSEVSTVNQPSTITDGDEEYEDERSTPLLELQAIRCLLDKLHQSVVLQEQVNHNKSTSSIEFLIGWDNLKWDFNSQKSRQRVANFRASALLKTDHDAVEYVAWNLPQYFSQAPLPPLKADFKKTAEIIVPQLELENLPPESAKPYRIEIGFEDTVELHLARCVEHFYNSKPTSNPINYKEFVFKVVGHNEYFDCYRMLHPYTGEPLNKLPLTPEGLPDSQKVQFEPNFMWSYQQVRKTIRDNLDLKLTLVRKPAAFQYSQNQLDQITSIKEVYSGQITQTDLDTVLHKDTYQHLLDIYAGNNHLLISQQNVIPMGALNIPFNVTVCALEGVNIQSLPRYSSDIVSVYVRVQLFHGYQELPFQYDTSSVTSSEFVSFNEPLYGGPQAIISLLPRETRIGYMLYGKVKETAANGIAAGDIQLGCVVNQLLDERGNLLSGTVDHSFWGFPASSDGKKVGGKRDKDPFYMFRCTNWDNCEKPGSGSTVATLRVKYPVFNLPVVAPLITRYYEPNPKMVGVEKKNAYDKNNSQLLLKVIGTDPLIELTPEHKQLLWNSRHYLIDIPSVLPKILQCIDWSRQDYRNEGYRLLKLWAIPQNPAEIIGLLDARFPDYRVREYAVNILKLMDDEDLRLYLLQLVQCLKYECYHDNPLTRFLIERAIKSPFHIAHTLFWHLKAEVHDPTCTERFSLILEELLTFVGLYMTEALYKQSMAVLKLQKVADHILRLKREFGYSDEETTIHYQQMLNELNEQFFKPQGSFQIPLNPVWEAQTLIVEKCRFMSSKMVPLWLVFKNTDPAAPPIFLIFKSGDDLRQDLLTLQVLRIMDRLWLQQGVDNRLKPYNVIATGVNDHGEGVGMIEVVLNSTTTSDIQVKYGGGATGALRLDPIDLYLRQSNPDSHSFTTALSNFVQSSAGYCVATFVLGVGDRHNGNIMVTKSGHLFHIDFGHFLGNFKKKFGVNRERAAFVFTPEMAYVIGGKDYKKAERFKTFRNECRKSFQVLRANASLLEYLFVLMIAAGMPELSTDNDILYLRQKLFLDMDVASASKEILSELKKSLDSTSRRFDNLIHNFKHA